MKKILLSLGIISLLAACGNTTPKAEAASTKSTSTAAPIELTSAQFKTLVADYTAADWKYLGDKPAIVDFYATWCGPCKQIAPILRDLATQYADQIVIYKVDVDKEPALSAAFGIQSIPTLLFIPTGDKKPSLQQGALPKDQIVNIINTTLLSK